MPVTELNGKNFDSEIKSSPLPVIVDFYAPWCAPCRSFANTVEKLGMNYSDRVKVGRVNIDAEEALARRYGIQSIPTVAVFMDGEIKKRAVGVRQLGELLELAREDK